MQKNILIKLETIDDFDIMKKIVLGFENVNVIEDDLLVSRRFAYLYNEIDYSHVIQLLITGGTLTAIVNCVKAIVVKCMEKKGKKGG